MIPVLCKTNESRTGGPFSRGEQIENLGSIVSSVHEAEEVHAGLPCTAHFGPRAESLMEG